MEILLQDLMCVCSWCHLLEGVLFFLRPVLAKNTSYVSYVYSETIFLLAFQLG